MNACRLPEFNRKASGFGLVEILVALVLGLFLTLGMTNVFLSSKHAYRTQDALSGVQENGRYAMEVLTRNVRMAGYQGCANPFVIVPNVIAKNMPPGADFSSETAVRGYSYSGGSFSPAYGDAGSTSDDPAGLVDGTDVITVSRAGDCGAYLVGNMATDNANIQLNPDNSCNFKAGEPVLITDCRTSDLFRATNVSEGSKITIAHANSQNITNRLSKPYGVDAQIFRFVHTDYYIANNAFGEPALFLREFCSAAQELVEGVENMQVVYGEDTNDDLAIDRYVEESGVGDWGDVKSVRLVLTLRSQTRNITIANSDPTDPTNDDRRMRQAMTSTIGVRNKLP